MTQFDALASALKILLPKKKKRYSIIMSASHNSTKITRIYATHHCRQCCEWCGENKTHIMTCFITNKPT